MLFRSCSAQASHCRVFSWCRAQALGAHVSAAGARWHSCSVACGIFLDQGLNPCPLHWQAYSYRLHHQKSHQPLFLFSFTSPVTPFNTLFLFMVYIFPLLSTFLSFSFCFSNWILSTDLSSNFLVPFFPFSLVKFDVESLY